MILSDLLDNTRLILRNARLPQVPAEREILMMGKLFAEKVGRRNQISSLKEVEFQVFSQFGDDGIIQWLTAFLDIPEKYFIEFGVEDYRESNTRFLMINNDWSGLVIDGSEKNILAIKSSEYFWRHDLQAIASFVTVENINTIISSAGLNGEIGILHIDIDGNDYWIWKAVKEVNPVIVIMEYNSVFGCERAVTVPYDKDYNRTEKHYSNLYFGASLAALEHLGKEKDYCLVGCNSAGNNAYFVRQDKMIKNLPVLSCKQAYVTSKFRESRDNAGMNTFLSGDRRIEVIKGLPVWNVIKNSLEDL